MVCSKAVDALISVLITGNVTFSAMDGSPKSKSFPVTKGDTMSLAFTVDPEALVRDITGQGIVTDGISPYTVCSEDFSLTFGSGMPFYLGPPPVTFDGTVGAFWFALAKSRPVYDGAYLSTDYALGSAGVPLIAHGAPPKQTYNGVFDLTFQRGTLETTDAVGAAGTYGDHSLVKSELKISRNWAANEIISISLHKMKIGPATGVKRVVVPVD